MADDKNPFPGENNTGHVWDDNIRELNNPIPRWWMIGFWASIIWWVAYGLLYPMIPLANDWTKGMLGWTMTGEYQEAVEEITAVRAQFEDQISALSAKEILADEGLTSYTIASARVLFGDNCAACHGSAGQGNPGFPVLADDDWLYGGSIEAIEQTLINGRRGMMIAHGKMLSDQEISTLANFVVGWSQGQEDPAGAQLYKDKGCFGCHGQDGKGLQMLGSANLTDAIWRFNEADKVAGAAYTIRHGVNDPSDPQTREAVMPAFKDRLSENDIKKLAVYVYSLGGGQ
ncbi:cytochrome-c oxidase, cbb3-type subunit III [Motiliproteus sediminis]|uniref:cytochrome-c oxidase, cbb3-type subunit III n=1 Tax=Motiliproteus sediminis TaxID=1468178 RepID=UPI001AEF8573|nr:cytochrome-c oxidase, cbb3-type subunit III [Motiliproteus sediminis]